jgi:hypothetical protein
MEIHVIVPPYVVLRRLRLPQPGRPGRGKPDDENVWYAAVRFVIDTGAMRRPLDELEYMLDDFSVHYKHTHGLSTSPAAMRSAVTTLRAARFCNIWPEGPDGRPRCKGRVWKAVRAHLALIGLKQIPRKKRRPKNGR